MPKCFYSVSVFYSEALLQRNLNETGEEIVTTHVNDGGSR